MGCIELNIHLGKKRKTNNALSAELLLLQNNTFKFIAQQTAIKSQPEKNNDIGLVLDMVKLSKSRESKLTRRKDGTFKSWKGGKTKAQLKKKKQNFHGIAVHIGKEFRRQNRRTAKVGDIVRTKKLDGRFHRGAFWYIRTRNGWRKSPSQTRKPTKAMIKKVNTSSRKGRR